METTELTEHETERRTQWLDGLHEAYEFYRTNPDLIPTHGFSLVDCQSRGPEKERRLAAAYVRALGPVEKRYTDSTVSIESKRGRFGPHCVVYLTGRASLCTKVVTEVEREVTEPDPEAVAALPLVTRTVTEQVVSWDCAPILGGVAS